MKKIDRERVDAVLEMILAIAHGDFSHRILPLDKSDWFDTILVQLNMLAEELENSLFYLCYINKDESFINRTHIFLNLDPGDRIIQHNSEAALLLRRGDIELLGCPITQLLSRASREHWKAFKKARVPHAGSDHHLQLEFLVKERLILNLACNTIPIDPNHPLSGHTQLAGSHIRMLDVEGQDRSGRIRAMAEMYSRSGHLYHDHGLENKGIPLSRKDILTIREVGQHLIEHFQEPMDSIADLARAFGTNEYKLKQGFKIIQGETMARFLQNYRLVMAAIALEHSELPINEIAPMYGFINPTHFSSTFKKKYGDSPKNYRKRFLSAVAAQIKAQREGE